MRSKAAREIFLTSSSLSFSSLSSSSSTWDDPIELRAARISLEEENGRFSNGSDEFSSVVTHVKIQPTAPSPPLKLRPSQLNNKPYDPERIPASIFTKTVDLHWSEISNDSLFSLQMEGCRMSNFRQSNIKPEDLFMSGEFLAYSPFLSFKIEDPEEEEEISEAEEEIKSGVTDTDVISVETTDTHIHEKMSFFSAPAYFFGHAPPPTEAQPFPLPVVAEKKGKKRRKTAKKNKEQKKNQCCVLSWLPSRSSNKCKKDLYCFKWRECCCYCLRPKVLVSSSS